MMRIKRLTQVLAVWLSLALILGGCSGGPAALFQGQAVQVTLVYGSEKQAWLEPLVAAFNAQRNKTAAGNVMVVETLPMGSVESGDRIVAGTLQPTVWSPASSAYLPVINGAWQQAHGAPLFTGTPRDLVLSPIVVAMWRPMAEALGWPDKALGWADIAALAVSPEGWAAYGYPEWGDFKFGHTHPNFSNSGLLSVIAEAYAGAGKQRNLTLADLRDPDLIAFMRDVESSIIHYGESTGFFATRMFELGPSYLSAAVLYENLIAAQESQRLAGEVSQLPVVAIYPKEGTFWSNHPYVILDAPWVTAEQREAAQLFERFLLDRPQQLQAIAYGFRPADPAIPLTTPLDVQHGVDPRQPQTVLEVPSAEVVRGIQRLWREEAKKPVDLVVLVDVSGSMRGEKINAARTSLLQFIERLDDRDRLEVTLFSDKIVTLTPLTPLGEKRADVTRRISGITESGDTRLYDAVQQAYEDLQREGDPNHIRAIVVLSDGGDTASKLSLDQLLLQIGNLSEGGKATKIFTIAFGRDAQPHVLRRIAEATGGKQYVSEPQTIDAIYAEIATFF